MDFFGAQDRARQRTGWLVALFALAIALIVATVYLAAVLALGGAAAGDWWEPTLFTVAALGVLGTVGVASGVRTLMLRSGGPAVAEMLGGRIVPPQTDDPDEQRLLNVVEEMALASGVPVPVVYVLSGEAGINAFAAGHGPEDAVVAVTEGALRTFTRDELQGVVAHEFSHILNRDVRLNLRLTGLLFGILALGLAGRLLLRSTWHVRGGRDKRGAAALVAVGLALFLTGYLGVFFGRLIRAAVSRQREYLADAAAVQFTRNPQGLADALKKIGARAEGSRVQNASAEEVSHFFFADAMRPGWVARLWRTHPPLVERIRRLDPSFDGDFQAVDEGGIGEAMPGIALAAPPTAAATVLGEMPPVLREAAGNAFSAVALVYGLMLDRNPDAREPQLRGLEDDLATPLYREVLRLVPYLDRLPASTWLPLADLAAPALHQLSPSQAERFCEVLARLARTDGRLSVFEFALEVIVRHRLAGLLGRPVKRGQLPLEDVLPDALVLLSALAHAGHPSTAAMQAAFRAGLYTLTDADARPVACTSRDLEGVLERLGEAAPEVRGLVVDACARTVLHDRAVTQAEGQLLRAVAVALEAPLPDFLPGVEAVAALRQDAPMREPRAALE